MSDILSLGSIIDHPQILRVAAKLADYPLLPPEILRGSDLVLCDTGDIVDRIQKSVRDVCKPSTATVDTIHDVSGIPES